MPVNHGGNSRLCMCGPGACAAGNRESEFGFANSYGAGSRVRVRSQPLFNPFRGMRIHQILLLMLAFSVPLVASAAEEGEVGAVWLVDLDGAVGPASSDLVIRTIGDAESAGAQALIVRMDTPGGLDKSMRDLVKAILGAGIPIVTFVAPSGARAASAGTYIAYASHIAAMAPATNIGSSTPVSIAPQSPQPSAPTPFQPPPERNEENAGASRSTPSDEEAGSTAATGASGEESAKSGESTGSGEGNETGNGNQDDRAETTKRGGDGKDTGDDSTERSPVPLPTDAMTRKVVNDAVAYLQGLAELRGRNVEWAEKTVREGANLPANAALEQNVIDLVSPHITDLLKQLDGREVEIDGEAHILATADAELVTVETDWRHELLSIITDPSIAYGLLIIGVYLLMLEFYNPGILFPAVTGIICMLLGAYGLQMLPVNYAGLALIIVGIAMLILEVMTPTYGVLGVGGVIAFVIGSIILVDSDLPGYQLPIAIIAGFTVATGGAAFFIVGAAVRARRSRVVTGLRGMVGGSGVVLDDFQGEGEVRAFGEIWRARSDAPLEKNAPVRIVAVDGLVLTVAPRR